MINLGLKRTARLLQLVAQKHFQQSTFQPPWRVVHIAGTNGKGSVAAYLSALLRRVKGWHQNQHESLTGNDVREDRDDSGDRIGRFTSPHSIDRWDCIAINDKAVEESTFEIAETEVKTLAKQVEEELLEEAQQELDQNNDDSHFNSTKQDEVSKEIRRDAQPTEFEILTATAFHLFSQSDPTPCSMSVIECGLGGRLDATNVLPTSAIAVSVITRIGSDHLEMLGGSLRSIVREKCGILRKEVPVVIDGENSQDVLDMIRDELHERFGEIWVRQMVRYVHSADVQIYIDLKQDSDDASRTQNPQSQLERLLPHQRTNLAVAIAVLEVLSSGEKIEDGPSTNLELTQSLLEQVLTDASHSYPARLQTLQPGWLDSTPSNHNMPTLNNTPILLDGAHNEQSALVLRAFVDRERTNPPSQAPKHIEQSPSTPPSTSKPKPTIWILALSSTKPSDEILRTLLLPRSTSTNADNKIPTDTKVIFTSFTTPPSMPWVRSASPATLAATLSSPTLNPDRDGASSVLGVTGNIVEALDMLEVYLSEESKDATRTENEEQKALVVVAGSLYLASDFLRFVRDGRGAFLEYAKLHMGSP